MNRRSRLRAAAVGVFLLATCTVPMSAGRAATPDPSPAPAQRGTTCPSSDCTTWHIPLYLHGSIPIPQWKRCIHWELRARVNARIALNSWGEGFQEDAAIALNLSRFRERFRVYRYCDTEHDATTRQLGGLHARPSIHMTGEASGSCSLGVSPSVSFPWAVSIEATVSCDEARVAKRESSFVSSKASNDYWFSEARPQRARLFYRQYESLLIADDYAHPNNIVCFRVAISGSAEHPRRAAAKAFGVTKARCINILDGR